jgi:site-specific DNA-methyltransferase (adenine-specific)
VEVKSVPLTQLQLDPNNARKHNQRNLDAIAESLATFGQRKPIVIHNGVVIAGNGTLEAAMSLGWTEISVAEVPSEWTEDTAKAFALADNRTAELAEWDEKVLATQLLELTDAGIEIADFGFSQEEQANIDDLADAFGDLGADKGDIEQITFTLHKDQAATIRAGLEASKELGEFGDTGNPNKNGNAITRIVELWLGSNVG